MQETRTIPIPVRMKPSSLARVDEIAKAQDVPRSQILRQLLGLGLRAYDEGKR